MAKRPGPITEQAPKRMRPDRYELLCDEDAGYCLACGTKAYGLEPDAHDYDCEECGESAVSAAEEMMLAGLIVLS